MVFALILKLHPAKDLCHAVFARVVHAAFSCERPWGPQRKCLRRLCFLDESNMQGQTRVQAAKLKPIVLHALNLLALRDLQSAVVSS